jgi:hypothetical protein
VMRQSLMISTGTIDIGIPVLSYHWLINRTMDYACQTQSSTVMRQSLMISTGTID